MGDLAQPESQGPTSDVSVLDYGREKILVGSGLFPRTIASLQADWVPKASRFMILTDENVWTHWRHAIESAFGVADVPFLVKILPPGEETKTRATKEEIENFMMENRFGRDSCLVAIGGGVVGDMGGFVAATYMRGIPFVQVPTTLLAMVDSSIGGKTGVDTPYGKNLVGAFHHPVLVCIDPDFLSTLDPRQYLNGFAEVIKTAAIRDLPLFQLLESNSRVLIAQENKALLDHVIRATAKNKAEVVALDSTEQGVRSTLNFGHTIGHAVEALVFPDLLHGECVSIGMILETKLSNFMGTLSSSSTVGRLTRCLASFQLPTTLPAHLPFQELLDKMLVDKKNAASKIRCTILKAIGDTIETPVPVQEHLLRLVIQPSLQILPKDHSLSGSIVVPGSKSLSNRVLALAALGSGECQIRGLLHADDTQHMLDALEKLGVSFHWDQTGEFLVLNGAAGRFSAPQSSLFLGNAGTASRFLTSLCSLLPVGASATLTGSSRLKERPIEDLTRALCDNGCVIEFHEKPHHFPFTVHGGGMKGGTICLSPEVSSQFVSSVLLSAPYAQETVQLILKGQPVSLPFIDMTMRMMEQFGIHAERTGDSTTIPQGIYQNPAQFIVEADASSASYPLAIAAITGGEVTVENVGANSLQGDSRFAIEVLSRMGCQVVQTDHSTTVRGPPLGTPLRAISIDMDSMTDTFMTAAVLMALAAGTSQITGIANQRVKECNRIEAMVCELGKIGVVAKELPDGIEIQGCAGDISKLERKAATVLIDCYKDHRIAMSFAVLGTRVPGLVITDKECVEKTFPEFWVAMSRHLGMEYEPYDAVMATDAKKARFPSNSTVVLVGMRGSGKSLMGRALAASLSFAFLDMDILFEKKFGSISEFVMAHGWNQFREHEATLLAQTIQSNPINTVISTGGGIVETQLGMDALTEFPVCVVHLHRPLSDVKQTLAGDSTRAVLVESIEDIWARRQPRYEQVSFAEFSIPMGNADWNLAETRFAHFIRRLLDGSLSFPSEHSKFLCLTFPNLRRSELPDVLFQGVQAVELRVDLLQDQTVNFVRDQLAFLRFKCNLPVIFTVRSVDEGGRFAGSEEELASLLHLAARTSCEFIDFQASWQSNSGLIRLLPPSPTIIIISVHDLQSAPSYHLVDRLFEKCTSLCRKLNNSMVKVVILAKSQQDSLLVQAAGQRYSYSLGRPCISIAAGERGKLSRVLNTFMTPVTHKLLPSAAAPGQLSVADINRLRSELGICATPS